MNFGPARPGFWTWAGMFFCVRGQPISLPLWRVGAVSAVSTLARSCGSLAPLQRPGAGLLAGIPRQKNGQGIFLEGGAGRVGRAQSRNHTVGPKTSCSSPSNPLPLREMRKPRAKTKKKAPAGMSISALSDALGVHRQTLKKVLVWLGVSPVGKVKGSPTYARADAEDALAAHRAAQAQQTEPGKRLTLARAVLAETKVKMLQRAYVPMVTVREWIVTVEGNIRAIVENRLRSLAPTLAGLDAVGIDARLKQAEDDLLTQLYDLRRKEPADVAAR